MRLNSKKQLASLIIVYVLCSFKLAPNLNNNDNARVVMLARVKHTSQSIKYVSRSFHQLSVSSAT
jgi:hypothetical protein